MTGEGRGAARIASRPCRRDADRRTSTHRRAASAARLAGDQQSFEAAAAERFRELGIPFWLAVTLLEHGELTGDESLLDEAREIFERLKATPWLERAGARHDRVAVGPGGDFGLSSIRRRG